MKPPVRFLLLAPFALLLSFIVGCSSTHPRRDATRERAGDTVVAFSAPSPLTRLSMSRFPNLKAKIDSLLPDSLFPPAHTGIKIVSLKSKEILYDLNSTSLFTPA